MDNSEIKKIVEMTIEEHERKKAEELERKELEKDKLI